MREKLKVKVALILSFLAVLSSIFARGAILFIFLLPISIAYYYILKGRILLRKREGNIVSFLFVLAFIPMFLRFDPFIVGLYFLCGLVTIKLFVSFESKDYDQIALLSFLVFSLSSVFLYSAWFILLFFVFMFFLTMYLLVRIVPSYALPGAGPVLKVLYVVPILLFLSLVLFFLLPRNPYMSFGLTHTNAGMDFDDVEVGDFTKSGFSERVLLRIKPYGKVRNYIYLRARVLDSFDGRKWMEKKRWYEKPVGSLIRLSYNNSHTERFSILPSSRFYHVPLVDYPVVFKPQKGRFSFNKQTMEVRFEGGSRSAVGYSVFSVNAPPVPLSLDTGIVNYLYVPDGLTDSLNHILLNIEFSNDTLNSLINFLREHHPYRPFVSNKKYPVLDFLKEGTGGECTEFATSFALFARLLGYKTRLVAGFLSDEFNRIGRYFVVREKHAHVWAEVFLKGKWVRFDPTPPLKERKSLFGSILAYYDFLQYLWFTRVVEFDYSDQMKFVIKSMPVFMKIRSNAKKKSKIIVFVTLSLIPLFGVYFLVRRRKSTPYERTLSVFFRYMRKRGFKIEEGETLLEFARRSKLKEAIEFVEEYYRVRYGRGTLSLLKDAILKLKNAEPITSQKEPES